MTSFKHVSRINVSLWGERVGTIVESPSRGVFAFRYEKKFLHTGIEISPLMMPLRAEPYVFPNLPRAAYYGLPPIFADSLPDTFGSGLIDHWLAEHGLNRAEITPLDRLAYLGRRTMGALAYEPDRGPGGCPTVLDLRGLVESARQVLNGELASAHGDDALREIIRLGSSAGGAQVGLHQLSVNGKRSDITDEDLLAVADRFGIGTARHVIEEVRTALETKSARSSH